MLTISLVTASLIASALAIGQIPEVNGVPGGVPTSAKTKAKITKPSLHIASFSEGVSPRPLRIVENSGVCESTPEVYHATGYGDISFTDSIWFWFFAARKDPKNAPLVVWLNGGPGSASEIGLFGENGPCRVTSDGESVANNPNSWNNVANMLYIDQPVGVGFSHGNTTVGTSQQAGAAVYEFLQVFFADARFKKYTSHDFGLWTESYGGHYGPTFAAYFLDKNAAIANGTASGVPIKLKTLGIGDGLTNPLVQYPGYIAYAKSNPYHSPLVNSSVIANATRDWFSPDGCKAKIQACYNRGSDAACSDAQAFCNDKLLFPLNGNYDRYYVVATYDDIDPYTPWVGTYVGTPELAARVGTESEWVFSSEEVYADFAATGDWMRNSAPDLEKVVNHGVRTLIFAGDADYIVNYYGIEAMTEALDTKFSKQYRAQSLKTWKVAGQSAGLYKNAGTFSYLRVYGAGHEVPAYPYKNLAVGQAALEFFTQTIKDQPLTST